MSLEHEEEESGGGLICFGHCLFACGKGLVEV